MKLTLLSDKASSMPTVISGETAKATVHDKLQLFDIINRYQKPDILTFLVVLFTFGVS